MENDATVDRRLWHQIAMFVTFLGTNGLPKLVLAIAEIISRNGERPLHLRSLDGFSSIKILPDRTE